MKKVGVIGVGSMGKNHVRAYSSLKDRCELLGIYDIDSATAEEVASSYGVKAFTSIESLIKEVDAVNIVTPTTTHYDIAAKAIEFGKHVLVEKPMTDTVEEAEDLIKSAEKKNVVLQVGHIERFNPAIRTLPSLLKDQEIVALNVQRMGPYDPRIKDTDVIQDLMIHDIDVVNSIIPAAISSTSAVGRCLVSDHHMDYVVANMLMDNGVIATLTASRVTKKKVRKMSIITRTSYIELDYLNRKIVMTGKKEFMPENSDFQQEQEFKEDYKDGEEPLKLQLKHFIKCVENNNKPEISGVDGLEALKFTKIIQNQVYGK